MKKIVALSLVGLTVFTTSCVSKKKYVELENQYNNTRSTLAKTQMEKEQIEAKYAKIEERVASYNAKIQSLSDSNKDRKSTRLNSSHVRISYAVFCLKK